MRRRAWRALRLPPCAPRAQPVLARHDRIHATQALPGADRPREHSGPRGPVRPVVARERMQVHGRRRSLPSRSSPKVPGGRPGLKREYSGLDGSVPASFCQRTFRRMCIGLPGQLRAKPRARQDEPSPCRPRPRTNPRAIGALSPRRVCPRLGESARPHRMPLRSAGSGQG